MTICAVSRIERLFGLERPPRAGPWGGGTAAAGRATGSAGGTPGGAAKDAAGYRGAMGGASGSGPGGPFVSAQSAGAAVAPGRDRSEAGILRPGVPERGHDGALGGGALRGRAAARADNPGVFRVRKLAMMSM